MPKQQKRGRDDGPKKRDPEVPINDKGQVYHIEAAAKDIAPRVILVGDPGRVPTVAAKFDKGSIVFDHQHREIRSITGTYNGVPVTAMSTGMGTDNVEIVLNELHVLREYSVEKGEWHKVKAGDKPLMSCIRVGTCGSPQDIEVGTLAITRHAIGLDNTCQYYLRDEDERIPSILRLNKIVNETAIGKVGAYASKAHPEVTKGLEAAAKKLKSKRKSIVGTTASCSGFYANQGRAVGRLGPHRRVPELVSILGDIALPNPEPGVAVENVVNIEMENSAICAIGSLLNYKVGTVCAIIAARAGSKKTFATPEQSAAAIQDGILVALETIIKL